MTYLITTNHPGNPEIYRTVVEHLPDRTDGLIARYAGMNDRGLAITSVWESKADSDRFTAERLMPVLRDVVGVVGEPDSLVVDFDVFDTHVPGTAP